MISVVIDKVKLAAKKPRVKQIIQEVSVMMTEASNCEGLILSISSGDTNPTERSGNYFAKNGTKMKEFRPMGNASIVPLNCG